MKYLGRWSMIALINLALVALLGFLMRAKMIFSIPELDFKFTLHAHSHFAFGGWVTLALLSLMSFRLLPAERHTRPVYNWLMWAVLVNAYGMMISFLLQGYAFFSILFSTLFIFITYAYAWVFVRDIRRTKVSGPVKSLAIGAVAYMALSSAGAFTLAYLLATKAQNIFLYKDAIYTYLHLQYSGFFTLSVFALLLHHFSIQGRAVRWFANLLNLGVIPSMFISYLWHYPGMVIQIIAWLGSALIVAATISFLWMLPAVGRSVASVAKVVRWLLTVALLSFFLKMVFQALTIVPALGPLVFANRPVIIGFLHLVLLAFITVYILAHFRELGLLPATPLAGISAALFATGVVLNEALLFLQGLGFMLMVSSSLMNWLLLGAAACLFAGALLIVISRIRGGQLFAARYTSEQTIKMYS